MPDLTTSITIDAFMAAANAAEARTAIEAATLNGNAAEDFYAQAFHGDGSNLTGVTAEVESLSANNSGDSLGGWINLDAGIDVIEANGGTIDMRGGIDNYDGGGTIEMKGGDGLGSGYGRAGIIKANGGMTFNHDPSNGGTLDISGGTDVPGPEILLAGCPIKITAGNGSPEGVVAANVGSLYLRLNGGAGTTLYVKQSGTGNTGWVGK